MVSAGAMVLVSVLIFDINLFFVNLLTRNEVVLYLLQ